MRGVQVGAESREGAGKARFGFGKPALADQDTQTLGRVLGWIQPVLGGVLESGNQGPGLGTQRNVFDPERAPRAAGVGRGERRIGADEVADLAGKRSRRRGVTVRRQDSDLGGLRRRNRDDGQDQRPDEPARVLRPGLRARPGRRSDLAQPRSPAWALAEVSVALALALAAD